MFCQRLVSILLILAIASCSSNDNKTPKNYGPTLADLDEPVIETDPSPVPPATLDQIEDSYRSALEVAKDPNVRHKILIRLADIEMAQSENEQVTVLEQKAFFTDAIAMYQELLTLNAERQTEASSPTNERLLYQLSKAYALDGRIDESNEILEQLVTDFPDSAFSAEADFRQAELAFSNQNYALAETLYAKVMSVGDDTPFYTNAVYMHGWSRFKRSRYRASIPSFTEVLDRTLIEGRSFDDLSNSERNLAKDTLRILSIVFSYLNGAETITDVYQNLGYRHYQFMLYSNLGELYYEKDRFRDSADTYLHYVRQFPDTDHSPAFSVKAIQVYEDGGFPSLVLPAKEEFVVNYGINSAYWQKRNEAARETLIPYLKVYLGELSSYYHAEAQALDQALEKYNAEVAKGNKPKSKPEPSQKNYLKAASLYGEFVMTFPQDEKTPEMTFLQGEAYYSAQKRPEAVDAFETVAYNYLDKTYGADAAYNAIVIMGEIILASANAETAAELKARTGWQLRKINSSISFADYYGSDERTAPALTKAAQELFEQKDLPRAITVARRLTEWTPPQTKDLQKTAWLILAHSHFELDEFEPAELAYRELLRRLDKTDPSRDEITERIAASIYRQSEMQVATANKALAIEKLLSIRDIAPKSAIATTAQYDAVNYLIEMQDWARAEAELKDFERRYPNHELIQTLAPKYVLIYQESEQWAKAAAILSIMSKSGDPETQRNSLYLAAELYERSGNTEEAIVHYRKYAHTYPEPFDIATEARFHLVELYDQRKEYAKKDFWLKKLIDADAKAGADRTARSKYLAAMAMTKFADDEFSKFAAIKLSLPIKKSMKKKKAAMDKTLDMYKKIMDLGIAEFVTEANHRIAAIYGVLSKNLMNSQRPKGLDALALEQYEILLEEQAYPFEEKAIDLYLSNTGRTQKGIYDSWVKASFEELAKILPARYGKKEKEVEVSDAIY